MRLRVQAPCDMGARDVYLHQEDAAQIGVQPGDALLFLSTHETVGTVTEVTHRDPQPGSIAVGDEILQNLDGQAGDLVEVIYTSPREAYEIVLQPEHPGLLPELPAGLPGSDVITFLRENPVTAGDRFTVVYTLFPSGQPPLNLSLGWRVLSTDPSGAVRFGEQTEIPISLETPQSSSSPKRQSAEEPPPVPEGAEGPEGSAHPPGEHLQAEAGDSIEQTSRETSTHKEPKTRRPGIQPEDISSKLGKLIVLLRWIPASARPTGHLPFRSKLLWLTGGLLAYFVLSSVPIWGLSSPGPSPFESIEPLISISHGTLFHLGVGPIVTASVMSTLLIGTVIDFDPTNPADRVFKTQVERGLVLALSAGFVLSYLFVALCGGPSPWERLGAGLATAVGLQIFLGAYLLYLLTDLIGKWGIGSGVGLIIVASVSRSLVSGALIGSPTGPDGTLSRLTSMLSGQSIGEIVDEGFRRLVLSGPNSLLSLVLTAMLFLLIVYMLSTRIELPLSHARVQGARGRYPIRLLYAGARPALFVAATLTNIKLMTLTLWRLPQLPVVGQARWLGGYVSCQPISGFAFYLDSINGLQDWLLPALYPHAFASYAEFSFARAVIRLGIFAAVMFIGCIVFAIFWVETSKKGPQAVAEKIRSSNMQLPGFSRDERILELVLQRYIPSVTIIAGASLGLIAVIASAIGTISFVGGVGLIVSISVLSRTYEQMAKEQMMEQHPMMRSLFG